MRTFDLNQQFDAIKKAASEALHQIFPIEGKNRKMVLNKVIIEDKLSSADYTDQAKTKLREGTWGVPVYASLSLVDKGTGRVLDSNSKVKLFILPKATDRFSYIVKGNEYQVNNQLRLRPGVYTIRAQNGELKTMVNLAVGKNFNIMFNEQKALFTITKVGGTQSNIALYPILLALGISPSKIADAWGSKIATANISSDPKAMEKALDAFGVKKGGLTEYFNNTKMDPEITKMTVGQGFDKVSGEMLLAASKKLLEVHLGKQEPEDRDSLQYKEIHSIDDFIKERIEKNKQTLEYKIKRVIDNPRRVKISQLVNPGAFHSVIESFFTQDDKSISSEQTNPLDMLSGQHRATIMGAGGIGSTHALTTDMREVHSSHYGFLDPTHTPESDRIGANTNLPLGVVKDGKDLKKVVLDKNEKIVLLTPVQAFNSKIAFPSQKGPRYKVMFKGDIVEVGKAEVDYFTPNPKMMFSWSTNLIPYLPAVQGNRSMMAAKHMEQAIALKHREEPLVQVSGVQGQTLEQVIGSKASLRAPSDGIVKKIDKTFITLKTADGIVKLDLYHNFPLNRKSFLHHDVLVKEGDKVKKGQLLADSNFTKNGTLALGTNLRVAYIPYRGLNFEDGIIISETAAKKLTSEHIHKKNLAINDTVVLGLNKFRLMYPNVLNSKNADKLDSDGVIKKGQRVEMGDIVIAALQKRTPLEQVGVLQKQLANRPKNIAIEWTYEDSGIVTDVHKTAKEVTIYVKTEEAAKIGDKLAGRFGNKGVITSILPDNEIPKNADGEPAEVLLNPHGVISRINIGQMYDSAAAKAAKKTGKIIVADNFNGENNLEVVRKHLKEAKVDDKEELFDPSGKSLGKVHVGNPYILKLVKQSQGNFSYRQGGSGSPYDANLQPLRQGGEESSKSLDLLTMYAMLSHGARANLRDMVTIKSNQNDEYWNALKSGQQLPPPKVPFIYDKFISYLKGAGIDVKKSGTKLTLAPLLDKEVMAMSEGEVKEPKFFRSKDLKPISDGFLDPVKFGGMKGTKWGHIKLTEPTVNPVFEGAIRKLTGLGTKFDDIMAGKLHLDSDGSFNKEGKGVTGGKAIEKLLSKIDVDNQIANLEGRIKKAKGDVLDDLNKKLRYLYALKKHNLKPEEAYIRKVVPVVPPVYRPIYSLPDGNLTTADTNLYYMNIGLLNKLSKLPVYDMLPEEDKADLRKDIYEHTKGLSGLVDIPIKGQPRAGFISEIKGGAGGSPKEGMFLSKILSKKQDYVGRATVIPETSLHIDEIGIPEKMAWKLFEPFVVRELVRFNKTPNEALEEIKKQTPLAKKALEIVLRDRKVLVKRDPVLHKFNIMAFKPTITSGTSIKIPPLVTKGFNMDFDGDTAMVHVPISNEANAEAENMLPSRNLFQPGTGKLMTAPGHEAQIGIYYLSKTPAGRKVINAILPDKYKVTEVLNKKTTGKLLLTISKELPANQFADIVHKLKSAGEKHAYERGFTLGLEDLPDFRKERDQLLSKIPKNMDPEKASAAVTKAVDNILSRRLHNKDNPLYDMIDSGARGDPSQLRSIMFSQLYVTDAKGKVIPQVIKKSYAEGLDPHEYWTSAYGARRGMIDKSIQTQLPGAFSKDILASTIDNVVSGSDCGTKKGVVLSISSSDVLDRYLADNQYGYPRNTLVDNRLVSALSKKGVKTIVVRSPLTCLQPKGVCSKCFGLNEHGHDAPLGENVGAKSGQAIAEPLFQSVMNTFHTGGAAGTGQSVTGYQRIKQLLDMPALVVGSTSLSPVDGKVKKIVKGLAGGYDVTIEDQIIHVSQGLALKVKEGDTIKKGDPLSVGSIRPQDLVKQKGMLPTQEYLVNELQGAYQSQGQSIQRKVFETVVRSIANLTKVINKPKGTDWIPGDIIPYTVAQHYNETVDGGTPIDEAEGLVLAKGVAGLREGHELTPQNIAAMKAAGIKEVMVKKEELEHEPIVKGIEQLPMTKKNWMAALGYRRLAQALLEGASQSWETDTSDYHPVPSLAYGPTFGKGTEGKY